MYLWIKAAHLASVLMFTGGLVMLFVAGSMVTSQEPVTYDIAKRLRTVVRRWDRAVTLPSLLLVWAFGLWMAIETKAFGETWMQVKLIFVLFLSGLHGTLAGRLRLANGTTQKNLAFPSLIITVCMLVSYCIVAITAVVKPDFGG